MKKQTDPIGQEIRRFLETTEGKQFFAEISKPETRQQKYDKIQSFLRIPENVRKWLRYRDLLEKRIKS